MKTLKFLAFAGIMLLFFSNQSIAQGRNPNAADRFPREHGRTMYDVDYWEMIIPCTGEFLHGTIVENWIRMKDSHDYTFWYNGAMKCYKTGNEYYMQGSLHAKDLVPGETSSLVTTLTLISKSGTKYRIHTNMHITCNQDGEVIADHDFENVSCSEGN